MFKTLLIALCLWSTTVYAQQENIYKTYCNDSKLIFDTLKKDYSEQPLVAGLGPDNNTGIMTLWVNPNTKTWSIILTYSEKSCIIGGGKEFTILGQSKSSGN